MTTATLTRRADVPRRDPGLRRFGALVAAESRILLRNKTATFTAVALPLFTALAFTGLAQSREMLGVMLSSVLISTGVLFVVYYTMVTSVVARREQLVLKRLIASEPTAIEVLLAPAVPLWIILSIQGLIAVLGAWALGAPLANLWALALAVIGGAAAWTALALWSSTWTRTVEAAQLTTMPFILLAILFSGLSLPLSMLPGWAERIAHWLPMTPVIDLINLGHLGVNAFGEAVSGLGAVAAAGQMLLPLAAWTALALFEARRSLRWDPRS